MEPLLLAEYEALTQSPIEILVAQGAELVEEPRNKADLRLKRN